MDRNFRRSRYLRYRGGVDPLAPPVDIRTAVEVLGRSVMEGDSVSSALRELLRRGNEAMPGLDSLREKVNKRRAEILEKRNLTGTFAEISTLLADAVLRERQQLARELTDDARFAELQIANLPTATAQAVQELSSYQWHSEEAQQKYTEIKNLLGQELLEQRFSGMKKALVGATAEDRVAITAMLKDLNALLAQANSGEASVEDFENFMNQHGEYFPENPQSLDELIEALARRSAAAQAFFNSLTPEQQAELSQLSQQAFGSAELMDQLSQMDSQLRMARPNLGWDEVAEFTGDDAMGFGAGAESLADLADLESLSEQLAQQYNGAQLADIDLEALARQLGDEAAVSARTLADLERTLIEQGYLESHSGGNYRLSPKAIRQIGESIFNDVAGQLSSVPGDRRTRFSGVSNELTGSTKEWEFGETGPWNVTGTLTNSIIRTVASGNDPTNLKIVVSDIQIQEMQARTQCAVALLVDVSFSMVMENRWVAMKRTAIALNHLISTRFRTDALQTIAFGRSARTISTDELIGLDGRYEQGTNLHHALLLAHEHLRKHSGAQPVVLIVTDGEPTAHLDTDGTPFFFYPPHPVTIGLTVRELDKLQRLGAQTTFFRLGDEPSLSRFIDQLAHRVSGRVVAPETDGLSAAVVADYLRTR